MTQEEYEAKVRSMPQPLQKTEDADGYMRGAEDMLESLKTASAMNMTEVNYYFGINSRVDCYPRLMQIFEMSADHILDAASKYKAEKARKDEEQVKSNVKTIADYIGIEKLFEIAEEIRRQKAADGDCLPF